MRGNQSISGALRDYVANPGYYRYIVGMNWKDHIVADPDILAGKPVIKGTRLSVGFILDLFAEGWNEQQILENYPQLTEADLQAIFAYTSACFKDEEFIALKEI